MIESLLRTVSVPSRAELLLFTLKPDTFVLTGNQEDLLRHLASSATSGELKPLRATLIGHGLVAESNPRNHLTDHYQLCYSDTDLMPAAVLVQDLLGLKKSGAVALAGKNPTPLIALTDQGKDEADRIADSLFRLDVMFDTQGQNPILVAGTKGTEVHLFPSRSHRHVFWFYPNDPNKRSFRAHFKTY